VSAHRPETIVHRSSTIARRIGVGAAALAVALALTAPAGARPLERDVFHDEFSAVVPDFCDEPGLTVTYEAVVDGRSLFNTRKPGTPPFYLERVRVQETITNEEGDFVTAVSGVLDKDLKITDNGDGTLTILVLATGSATLFDSSGKAIARNPGQVRFEILIDHGGTPADPSDDEFLEFLGLVKGSTGRNDDFCAAIVEALG
jgi:hypothetical protein